MELYPFQRECVDKLAKQTSRLIGDEMGLGKTVEALELDRMNRETSDLRHKKTLIVAPLSVLSSWRDHTEHFAPSSHIHVIDPKNRELFVRACTAGLKGGIYICHWDALRLMPELRKVKWFHIIADEVHRAKNRKSQQTRALKGLKTTYKTGLSGTPADNKPQDLWSIINWLWPNYFTSYWNFYKRYLDYEVDYGGEGSYHKVNGVKNVEQLQAEMAPWYVRRLKTDVLKDLPEKYYTDIWVELTPKQRVAYDHMKKHMVAWIGQHEDEVVVAPIVVAQLQRLQQFAISYAHLEAIMRKGEEAQVVRMWEPSSKLDVLMELLEDNPDEQVVVFSQFKQAIRLLAARLEARNISAGYLTGDTPQNLRGDLVERFQSGKLRVFAGTITAGGVGITLTAASTVVFLDRAWSPAWNKQAEDRLHRIGQSNAVQVIDIMSRSTVDLGKRQQLELKWSWIKKLLGS